MSQSSEILRLAKRSAPLPTTHRILVNNAYFDTKQNEFSRLFDVLPFIIDVPILITTNSDAPHEQRFSMHLCGDTWYANGDSEYLNHHMQTGDKWVILFIFKDTDAGVWTMQFRNNTVLFYFETDIVE